MKILVYGSKGWIGKQFINILETIKSTSNTDTELVYVEGKSRVDDEKQLLEEIKSVISYSDVNDVKLPDEILIYLFFFNFNNMLFPSYLLP